MRAAVMEAIRQPLVVRDVPEPLASRLNELRQGFPGTELKECQPEEKRSAG